MGLIKGKSKKAFSENVETEMNHGKPQSQALAIAYNTKRKAQQHQKMAEGGMIGSHQSPGKGHTINIHVNPMGGYDPTQSPSPKHNSASTHEGARDLNQHGEEETGPMGAYAMGGEAKHQTEEHEDDMVGRIMKKRANCYSEGGKVANENAGESASDPESMAKDDPNEFDDLALRDDLSFEYTGANAGDEDGSTLNQTDEGEDMIGRIMRKRAKK